MVPAKIVEIDCSTGGVSEHGVSDAYRYLGGRAMTSRLIAEEVEPTCHPLGRRNVLVFAPGLLAGTALSSANRLSAGAKSPLTGGIKESNSGGVAARKLARLGIKALKLTGQPPEDAPLRGIRITTDGVALLDLADLKGAGTYETTGKLRELYGAKAGLLVIGPAGEMRLSTASINVTDREGEPCRNLGRGGLGAVMGSKGMKAIIVDDSETQNSKASRSSGAETVSPEVRAVVKKFGAALREHPVTGERFAQYGTAMTLSNVNALGGLPTRNYSRGSFEHAEAIGGDSLYETISSRGGSYAHACMPGCVIRCSNKYVDQQGKPVVGSVDYETLCLLGSNIGLGELDQIADLNYLCNDLGIDTIETGAALGVLADAGVWEFGDYQHARTLIQELGQGTPLGRLLGSGAAVCGRVYGVQRVPTVKGQSMAALDPRAIKGMGLTYAMSPMGADHTAGNAIVLAVDHLNPKAQLEPVRDLHLKTLVLDALGLCLFTARVSLDQTSLVEECLRALVGWNIRFDGLLEQAQEWLLTERRFNERAGITAAHDRLPEFMYTDALAPNDSVCDIPQEDYDCFYDFK